MTYRLTDFLTDRLVPPTDEQTGTIVYHFLHSIFLFFWGGLKGGKGPWWSALGPPGVLHKCREMPTVS